MIRKQNNRLDPIHYLEVSALKFLHEFAEARGQDRILRRRPGKENDLPLGCVSIEIAEDVLREDNCALGVASVDLLHETSGAGVTVWLDQAYRYVMIFSGDPLPDVNRRSLAVEPMTCPPNAFRTGQDVVRLEPGASFTSTWVLTPRFPRNS